MLPPPSALRVPAPVLRLALAGLLVAVVAGCAPPDRPPALARELPDPLLEVLHPDSLRVIRVADGVFDRYLWSPVGPWAVHLLEVDLTRCRLGVEVAPAGTGLAGRRTVSELVAEWEGDVLAAVNGDFFTPEGRPWGPRSRGACAGADGSARRSPSGRERVCPGSGPRVSRRRP